MYLLGLRIKRILRGGEVACVARYSQPRLDLTRRHRLRPHSVIKMLERATLRHHGVPGFEIIMIFGFVLPNLMRYNHNEY
jgi:hypothetical protein